MSASVRGEQLEQLRGLFRLPGPREKTRTRSHSHALMDTADESKCSHSYLNNTCPIICVDKEKQGSWNTWKPFDSE